MSEINTMNQLDKYRRRVKHSRLLLSFSLTFALAFGAECALSVSSGQDIFVIADAEGQEDVGKEISTSSLWYQSSDAAKAKAESVALEQVDAILEAEKERDEAERLAQAEQEAQEEEEEAALSDEEMLSYILENPELYTEDLTEFAQEYPEVVAYVYQYPEMYGEETEIDLSEEAASDTVPLLLQWDSRWGYLEYGTGLIGYTGCGPTCLSMAALYLTGDAKYTPAYIASYADENGYYVEGEGTSWSLLTKGCKAFGMISKEVKISEDTFVEALGSGGVLICSVTEGNFTVNGHFIVVAGYEDGAFTVNDPNSPANSSRTWTFEELEWQIRCAWAFYKAE